MDDPTTQESPDAGSQSAHSTQAVAANVPVPPAEASAAAVANSDDAANTGVEGAAGLDENLERLLRDLENPELFSLRNLFNMC